ncbi:MAG: hypothetical protein KGO49_07235 [Gammaproteobacteria bacterium]|nr:hypothetical protein [Gammaproteobacteria bacterium]
MFLPYTKKIVRCGFVVLGLCLESVAFAAPSDVFLHTEPNIGDSDFRGEIGYDVMNSAVDVFNLRSHQGSAPDHAGDYDGGHLTLGYNLSPNWSTEATYWRRDIAYGVDTNSIDSWLVSLYYDPFALPLAEDRAVLRLSLWGDHASQVNKSTPTKINTTTFNQVTVNNPNDIQAQLDAIFSSVLNERNLLTWFLSAGVSKVDIGDINAVQMRGNCKFNVDISTDNIATGTLAAPCSTSSGQLLDASFTANASQYGVDVKKDFNYTASFLGLGGSWRWKYNRFTTNLGYEYQYIRRNGVDKQVSSFGATPITSNQTLGLDVAYKLNKNLDIFVQGQAFKSNFVGTIPFLYNTMTAGRLDRYYGVTSLGLRFSGF